MQIIGRNKECERLERCLKETQAQLIVVSGRRRVGKTFLIDNFFENKIDFKFTGSYNQDKKTQLTNFITELNSLSNKEYAIPSTWQEAFNLLKEYILSRPKEEKTVIFFDEMPWMDSQASNFLPAFEWFWNGWGSSRENLVFILCGSATSWISEKILENKGGLFNRLTCSIFLEPFSLYETEQYLLSRNINWSRYDITLLYMVLGGIPFYLRLLDPELTVDQNINNLFFKKRGELWNEFDNLYQTLFKNSKNYIAVVEALSNKRIGLSRKDISNKTKLSNNGELSKILKDLVACGFVREYTFYGNKKKDTLYQLADYYSIFYFKYIRDNYGKDDRYWINMRDNPSRAVWAGLTFEQVCKDHINQIKNRLGILGVLTSSSSWFNDEAEIDMLIERRDGVINICEDKFSINEFEIDKEYHGKLVNKIESFKQATKSNKTIQLTMITTFGLKQNKYSNIVTNQVTLDDLFEKEKNI